MNEIGTIKLETDRLILRRPTIDDAKLVFAGWASDEKVTKFLSWNVHKDVEETEKYLLSVIEEIKNGGYHWVVELKDTHELIGDISAVSINRKHENCEIGYCYGSKFWGNDYATEALKRVIDFMLNDVNFHLVEAKHISLNSASGRVMQKAGMKLDGVLKERRIDKLTGEKVDLVIYSITKKDL